MSSSPPLLNWRLRLIWLRSLLVLAIALALLAISGSSHSGYQLGALLWLAALLLPNVLTLCTRQQPRQRQQHLLSMELVADVLLFTGLLHGFGGAGNPLSFYLLLPVLLAALTLPTRNAILVAALALGGYLLAMSWYRMPEHHSALHALSHDLSGLHGAGMAGVFILMLVLLSVLGQTIQKLVNQQQRQQEQALNLAGRRERLYQVAATLAHQAHELNTPLATLVMLADNMRQTAALPDSLRDDIEQVDALARHVANRLKQPASSSLSGTLPLSQLVDQLQQQLRHLAPTLQVHFDHQQDPLLDNPEDWLRVLTNLGYNAMDAGASQLDIKAARQQDRWLLQVSDNGPGQQRSGRDGMGIGLTLIDATLEQLGAELELDFGPRWTQARIYWGQNDD